MIQFRSVIFLFILLFPLLSSAQNIDHWETVKNAGDVWRYYVGNFAAPDNWNTAAFNDSNWPQGTGGFGYGDDDDGTQVPATMSVFLRTEFNITNLDDITWAVLHADYDDAFVAYLNGVEIARSNIGQVGIVPAYNEAAYDYHEAALYTGGQPEAFNLDEGEVQSLLNFGTNTLAIQVHNENINSSDFSSNFFFSVAISNPSFTYGPVPSWFNNPIFASKLPLMVIKTEGSVPIPDEPKIVADMGIIYNGPGEMNNIIDPFTEYDGKIAIEIRGASSTSFDKKGFGFETQDEAGENNNVTLLGMPKENDWILHGPYSDKSLLRNVLTYHMAASTGQYAPRTRLIEVLINNDYRGVYMLTERIKRDKNRVDVAKLDEDDIAGDSLTGGYIYQMDRDDFDTEADGWYPDVQGNHFYRLVYPDDDDIQPAQRSYIENYTVEFEQAMKSSNYQNLYTDYVDVDSWIDYFLVTEVGKHIDSYRLSFYMYKVKDSKGGKINFGPIWDFNLGYGNFDFACSPNPSGFAYRLPDVCAKTHPFWVKKLVDIPEVSNLTNCRWQELRSGPLHTDSLMNFIDGKILEMGNAPERNFNRWGILGQYVWPNDFVGNSYIEEVNFLKNWVTQRMLWMDLSMIGEDCEPVNTYELIRAAIKLYPNPVANELNISIPQEFINLSAEKMVIHIFNITGSQILEVKLVTGEESIDLHALPKGLYTYSLTTDSAVVKNGKLIKL